MSITKTQLVIRVLPLQPKNSLGRLGKEVTSQRTSLPRFLGTSANYSCGFEDATCCQAPPATEDIRSPQPASAQSLSHLSPGFLNMCREGGGGRWEGLDYTG